MRSQVRPETVKMRTGMPLHIYRRLTIRFGTDIHELDVVITGTRRWNRSQAAEAGDWYTLPFGSFTLALRPL